MMVMVVLYAIIVDSWCFADSGRLRHIVGTTTIRCLDLVSSVFRCRQVVKMGGDSTFLLNAKRSNRVPTILYMG